MLIRRPLITLLIVFMLVVAISGVAMALLSDTATDRRSEAEKEGLVTADFLNELLASYDEEAFERPSGPWQVTLPDDHGGHPDMRAESWMISAHLKDETGTPIGVTFSLSLGSVFEHSHLRLNNLLFIYVTFTEVT